jgi:hypothetical protein
MPPEQRDLVGSSVPGGVFRPHSVIPDRRPGGRACGLSPACRSSYKQRMPVSRCAALLLLVGLGAPGCGSVAERSGRDAAAGDLGRDAADGSPEGGDANDAGPRELCNGEDDDGDGVIDNGCPLDGELLTTRVVASQSPIFGSLTEVGNVTFTDSCPDGQAVIGFTGNSGSGLDAVGVNCGTLSVREDRSTVPYRYSIAVASAMQYAPEGGGGGGQNAIASALACGVNEVVSAIQIWVEPAGGACAGNGCAAATTVSALGCPTVYGLSVSCTRYTIGGAPGRFELTAAAGPTMTARAGATGRSGVAGTQAMFGCGVAGALREAKGASGRWPAACANTVVNGLQFACTNPVIPVR